MTGQMLPAVKALYDQLQEEGTPKAYAMAHDVKLIDESMDAFIKAMQSGEGHWHSNALNFLLREVYVPNLLRGIARLQDEDIFLFVASAIEAVFMSGLLIGESSEHITPCNCIRQVRG